MRMFTGAAFLMLAALPAHAQMKFPEGGLRPWIKPVPIC
jgi:hypothetical protein